MKVDEEDGEICALMAQQATRRPFSLRNLVTPRGGGFKDLWKAYNQFYKQTSDSAYFVCLISDEVEFNQSGWDLILRNYVGIYPDHIFRLLKTQLKLRNYYDF